MRTLKTTEDGAPLNSTKFFAYIRMHLLLQNALSASVGPLTACLPILSLLRRCRKRVVRSKCIIRELSSVHSCTDTCVATCTSKVELSSALYAFASRAAALAIVSWRSPADSQLCLENASTQRPMLAGTWTGLRQCRGYRTILSYVHPATWQSDRRRCLCLLLALSIAESLRVFAYVCDFPY